METGAHKETHRYFKFRAINKYLIESLVFPSIFMAKRQMLNDPFDCSIDLIKSIGQAIILTTIPGRVQQLASLLQPPPTT